MKRFTLFLAFLAFIGTLSLNAQTREISGLVIGAEDGQPIPGVSVVIKGTTIGTTTDIDGRYSISVPDDAETLVFSFVGMANKEVPIGEENIVNTSLQAKLLGLDEVVVTAYGTQTKRSLTGSQTEVGGEELQRTQVSNITRALEGAVAGVQTTSSSGQPGSGASVRIRGMGSLSASSSPLYVVDGVPYEGNINNISQIDVESMTVLKDASATALYGARAANGVILITTRRGTNAQPRIVIDSRVGVNSRAYEGYDMMTSPENYYEMFWEALRNDRYYNQGDSYLSSGVYASNRLIKYQNPQTGSIEWMLGYNNYDVSDNQLVNPLTGRLNQNANLLYNESWEDEVFEPGIRQEHSASLSGVNQGTNYFLSFNYLDDEGYSPNTGFERYSSRLKVTQDVTDWLQVTGNVAYINTDIRNPTSTGTSSANLFYVSEVVAPIYPVFQHNLDGTLDLDENGEKQYDFGDREDMKRPVMPIANPAGTQKLNTESTKLDRINIVSGAEISFTDDLKLSLNLGVDNAQTNRLRVDNRDIGQYAAQGGYIYKSSGVTRTVNLNQILSYDKEFGDNHSLIAKLGHELYTRDFSLNYGGKTNYLFPSIDELDWAVVMSSVGSYGYDYALESYFGTFNYGFMKKYYVDASLRYDGSSRFHPDNRWGTFWSAGASWIINQEAFLQNLTALDILKLRISYGKIGNDNLGTAYPYYYYYAYEDQYSIVNNDNAVGFNFAFKGNQELKWESNNSFTVGIDYGFLTRFSGSVDFFTRTSSDLLFILPQAPSTGISEIPYNLGKLTNTGVEFELQADIINTNDFYWSVSFNATNYSAVIEELPEIYKENGLIRGGTQKWEEGESPYLFFMREYAGVDPESGRAMWYMDILDEETGNVTGRETTTEWGDATRYNTGKDAVPDLFGGINMNFEYKGFDLGIQTAYQLGGYTYDGIYASFMHAGDANSIGTNWHRDIYKRWTPQNTNTDVPIIDRYRDANGASDRFLIDGSYFSLRNIVIGYTLPQRITEGVGIQSLRFYIVGDNVFFTSKRQGFDPRLYFDGVVTGGDLNYSPIKTISGGINLTF